jgi:catechol 2,3-dioxygenase-like lactoylglutathione lyase family enzyme
MTARLEHANLTVPDIDAAIAFLQAVEPSFQVRHDETPAGKHRWVHVGSDEFYIALEEPHRDSASFSPPPKQTYHDFGFNHLAWVVDDFEAVVARLEAAGYRRGMEVEPHLYRKRAYFFDSAGFEWEIVEYLSEDPAERNAYE